ICESLAAHASRRSRRSLLSMRLLCFNELDLILRRPRSGRLEGWAAIPICDFRKLRTKLATAGGNRKKVGRFQAGAADQCAVDVLNCHQFSGVRGFHGTAIEDAGSGPLPVKSCNQEIPDKLMNL